MTKQTQNTNHSENQTEPQKKEEGAHMTTKSMQMSRSSNIHSHAETKKIIDAEECQAQSDELQLTVDCRISADTSIINFISHTGIQSQIGMLMETTAKAARSILLLAADRTRTNPAVFENACMEIHLRFSEPEMLYQICQTEEEYGKN